MGTYKGTAKIAFSFKPSHYCTEGKDRSYNVSVSCLYGGHSDAETRKILKEQGEDKLGADVGYGSVTCYEYSELYSEYQIYKCDD